MQFFFNTKETLFEKIARLGWFLLCVVYSLYDQLLTFFQQDSL